MVILYPLVKAVLMSFQKDSGLDTATGLFVEGGNAGLSNYTHWLLQQCGTTASTARPGTLGAQFYDALWVTLFFTVATVAIEVVLGLWFAMIMNRTFKGRGLVRAAILVPVGHPHRRHREAVVLHLRLRRHRQPAARLRRDQAACCGPVTPGRPGSPIVIADVWKTTPFMALLILAGLQLIRADVYEAAQIDGASKWQTFTPDHPAAGQGAAHGRRALPHPGRAAHLRPAGHPHQAVAVAPATRRRRCPSW